MRFSVLTNYPNEWVDLAKLKHNIGIFPLYHNSAPDQLHYLSEWGRNNRARQKSILLLIDGLDKVGSLDFDNCQTLRYLLLRGPARRVWPIVSLNAQKAVIADLWLDAFRTRIFGNINNPHTARSLSYNPQADFSQLQPVSQFVLRDQGEFLRFSPLSL